jgi:hypothetical protein
MSNPLYAFPTTCEQTLQALARYPSRTAFAWPDGSITYQGTTDLIGRIQNVFTGLGLKPGARVAFLTANHADAWCAGVAVQLSQLAVTWLHPLGSLGNQLFRREDSEAQMLVVDIGRLPRPRRRSRGQGERRQDRLYARTRQLRHRSVAGDRAGGARHGALFRTHGRHSDAELYRRHHGQIQGRAAPPPANMAASPTRSSPTSKSRRPGATSRWRRSAMSPAPRCCRP